MSRAGRCRTASTGTGHSGVTEVLRIGMQTAAGLAAAHAQGLVHRDVKPANILLENSVERVRLTDFGLARAVADAGMSHSGVVAGTPHYMAPEQARGETTDHRADLFSLGSTLYADLCGPPAVSRRDSPRRAAQGLRRAPRPLREINPDVPAWLDALVARLMAKDPSERYQTAEEAFQVLQKCLAHVQQPLASPLPAGLEIPRSNKGRGRVWKTVAALALVGVVSVAIAGRLYWKGDQAGELRPAAQLIKAADPLTAESWPRKGANDNIEQMVEQTRLLAQQTENDLVRRETARQADQISTRSSRLMFDAQALEQRSYRLAQLKSDGVLSCDFCPLGKERIMNLKYPAMLMSTVGLLAAAAAASGQQFAPAQEQAKPGGDVAKKPAEPAKEGDEAKMPEPPKKEEPTYDDDAAPPTRGSNYFGGTARSKPASDDDAAPRNVARNTSAVLRGLSRRMTTTSL